jgi:hypothetical protein
MSRANPRMPPHIPEALLRRLAALNTIAGDG